MANITKMFEFILPKKKAKAGGDSYTNTFRPGNGDVLAVPDYREHLTDLFDTRQSSDSKELLQELFVQDPDCSATVNAYLTLSDTDLVMYAVDSQGVISEEGTKQLQFLVDRITTRNDYSLGFQLKQSLTTLREELKYMLLLRGVIGAELVVDKTMLPSEIRNVDMAYVEWKEAAAGQFKPIQTTQESNTEINLDIPTFFCTFYRRDPTKIYAYSPFVSAINSIAARQQVINDLYRIMTLSGYPKVHITVVEEILKKNAPVTVINDPTKYRSWINSQIASITNTVASVRPEQPIGHTDSIQIDMLNDKNPGSALQINEVIETLNAQNQAGMKVVSSVLGRGSSGVNTATVEAQVFTKNAQQINKLVDYILSEIMTLALRLNGFDGKAVIYSDEVNLRTDMELENQRTMKQARYQELLSLGEISDLEFHLAMFKKIPPEGITPLSGTNFQATKINTSDTTSNTDPLGRSLTPEDNDMAKSNSNTTVTDQQRGKDLN